MSDATLAEEIPEFRGEFEQDLVRWFRRRFGWMCATYAVLLVVFFATLLWAWTVAFETAFANAGDPPSAPMSEVADETDGERDEARFLHIEEDEARRDAALRQAAAEIGVPAEEIRAVVNAAVAIDGTAAALGLIAIAFFASRIRPAIESRAEALAAATRLLLLLGALTLLGELAKRLMVPAVEVSPLSRLMLLHLFACLFLPWAPRESVRPMLPLIAVWAAYRIATGAIDGIVGPAGAEAPLFAIAEVAASPLVLLPGMGLSWWRMARYQRRFGREFTGRKFRALRSEIRQARTIHDGLFPRTFESGDPIRFDFAYAPANDLGGDFLHVQRAEDGSVTMVLLDVTGHGLSAAMTVNRLVGEIERLHAERPGIGPGELLAGLNRYVHLTLARHSLLATAAAVLIEPRHGRTRIANAGHPPLLRRRRHGGFDRYDATEPLLGALPPEEFGTSEHRVELMPGDTLFAYTDGAFEARDRGGRELGLDAFLRLCGGETPSGRWPHHLLRVVENFEGPVRGDDVLVATLAWTGPPAPRPTRPSVSPSPLSQEETCA